MMLTRRDILGGLAASAALIWSAGAMGQAEEPAQARIKEFYDRLQAATAETDAKKRFAAVSDAMKGTFDIAAITRLSIGPQWSKIPDAKQAALEEAFGRYFIATYAGQLGKAAGSRFEVLPKTEKRTAGQLVHTRVIDTEGKTTPVDYVLNADGKVVDIYLGGTVSMLAARRSEYDGVLKKGGPDALEAHLRQRAEAAMGAS